MAIDWHAGQRDEVKGHLDSHPVDSGECLEAARKVLPVAQVRDPTAHPWKLVPLEGRFVVPRSPLERRWFHHYTVELLKHCVDAVVGPDGAESPTYLQKHWQHSECINWQTVDFAEEET